MCFKFQIFILLMCVSPFSDGRCGVTWCAEEDQWHAWDYSEEDGQPVQTRQHLHHRRTAPGWAQLCNQQVCHYQLLLVITKTHIKLIRSLWIYVAIMRLTPKWDEIIYFKWKGHPSLIPLLLMVCWGFLSHSTECISGMPRGNFLKFGSHIDLDLRLIWL